MARDRRPQGAGACETDTLPGQGSGSGFQPRWHRRLIGDHGTRVVVALAASVVVHALLLLALALMLRSVATSGGGTVASLDLGAPIMPAEGLDVFEEPQSPVAEPIDADPIDETAASQAVARATLDSALERLASAELDAPDTVEVRRGAPDTDVPILDRSTDAGTAAFSGLTDLDATASLDGASFAGVSAQRARSVVYAVDASGAMVTSLPFVLEELRRSISALASDQSFAVVLFGRRPGGAVDDAGVRVFPNDGLVSASPGRKAEVLVWLESAQARGASNPLDGLLAALDRKPEVVFLLSRSIRRTDGREAAGDWGPGREAILAELDRANPVLKSIFGPPARAVQVKCVQFLEEDPSGVMRAIAEVHGGGEGSYRLLPESELRRR